MDYQRACQLIFGHCHSSGPSSCGPIERPTGALPDGVDTIEGYRNRLLFFTPEATTPYSLGFLDLANAGSAVMDVTPRSERARRCFGLAKQTEFGTKVDDNLLYS